MPVTGTSHPADSFGSLAGPSRCHGSSHSEEGLSMPAMQIEAGLSSPAMQSVGAGMPATGTSHPAESFRCSAAPSRCHGSSHSEKGVSMPAMQSVGAGMPATGTSHPVDSFGCSAAPSRCHGSSHTEKGVSMPVMQSVGAGMPATGTSHPADSFGCSAGPSRCHGSSHTEKGVSMPVMQSFGAGPPATATNCGSRHAGDRQRCEPADAQNPAGCPRALGSTVTFFALALAAARVMRKQLPPPATGTYSMLAWLASISCRAMYRPRPVPCSLVV